MTRVLVVTPDRALRSSLAYLLRMEPDLEVWDCSPREATGLVGSLDPDVILAGIGWEAEGKVVIPLSGLAPYETLLGKVRAAG